VFISCGVAVGGKTNYTKLQIIYKKKKMNGKEGEEREGKRRYVLVLLWVLAGRKCVGTGRVRWQ
jgi:hypothetical protein